MCLAIPGILRSIDSPMGVVDYGGLQKKADLTLTPQAKVGDAVIVHAGFAIAMLEEKEGAELIRLARETGQYG